MTDRNFLPSRAPNVVRDLADAVGGKIDFVSDPLPDDSGFATMSLPLPKDHWLKAEGHNEPPMPFRIGRDEDGAGLLPHVKTRADFAEKLKAAARYAVRASTMNGQEIDFDPDAMVQNFVVGMLGYWTPNGLSGLDGHDETPRVAPALAWVVVRASGKHELVFSPLTDETNIDEGDEAFALFNPDAAQAIAELK